MEDVMSNTFRTAALAAALLAGTAAAHAQTVIVQDPYYGPPPVAVAPAPQVIVPAPGVVVAEPPPMTEDEVVTEPEVRERIVERPAPTRRIIQRTDRTMQVRLTHAQRRDVLRIIRYERPAPVVTERIDYRVGSVLPATVPVYAMPQQVVYEAPSLRGYEYTTVGDRVLLVDPGTGAVVDELY
jgi:hypothetical protein